MKTKIKLLFLLTVAIAAALLLISCSDESPYGDYNEEGYTVSVKYDANGGAFTTGTSVIVDTYAADSITADENGNKSITLISPDNKEVRGDMNAFLPIKNGYSLVGWYTERYEVKDENGNVVDVDGTLVKDTGKAPKYTYSGRWDFSRDRFTFDASKPQDASKPIVTLYAAWVKDFVYEFYYDGQLIDSITANPIYTPYIKTPSWDLTKGTINMEKFPKINGKTFVAVYSDAEMTELITGDRITHSGNLDLNTATAGDTTMRLYIEMKEGNWFKISTPDQLSKNASLTGCYEILADLDFSDAIWPSSFTEKNFAGTILGGGHTISNVKIEQTNMNSEYFALFGQLSASSSISDLTFDNITVQISKGTRKSFARYGVFAGTIDKNASVNNLAVTNSVLKIDASLLLASDIDIGLVAGIGYEFINIDYSSISCEAIDKETYLDTIEITVEGNEVTVVKVPKPDAE